MAELKNNTPEQENDMKLKTLPYELTVCKLSPETKADLSADFFCLMKTDEEISLVCRGNCGPGGRMARFPDRGSAGLFPDRHTVRDFRDPGGERDRDLCGIHL